MASRSVMKKAPQLHQKPKGQPAELQLGVVQLTAEEIETLRKIACGVENLKTIAERCHDIEIGEFFTPIELLSDATWELW